MFAKVFIVVFSLTVAASAARVTLCEGSDITCVRETFASLLGYAPLVGNGTDKAFYSVPITVDIPAVNVTVHIFQSEFAGFSNASILDFYQEEGYTGITIYFPNVILNATEYVIETYSPGTVPQSISTFGFYSFPNVTVTVTYPGTESISVYQAKTTAYQEGTSVYGLEDAIVQAADNAIITAAINGALANLDVVTREILAPFSVRYALVYALNNLAYNPATPV